MVRAHSTVLTGGLGNVIIATMELGGALSITFMAFVAPVAAVALIVAILWLMLRLVRRLLAKAEASKG